MHQSLDINQWPTSLLFPYEGYLFCPGDVTDLASWRIIEIMASLYPAPYSSFISSYPNSSMGWQFTGSGCIFPHMKNFLSSKIIFIISQKILLIREKDFSVWTLGGGVGVFRLWSETELMVASLVMRIWLDPCADQAA